MPPALAVRAVQGPVARAVQQAALAAPAEARLAAVAAALAAAGLAVEAVVREARAVPALAEWAQPRSTASRAAAATIRAVTEPPWPAARTACASDGDLSSALNSFLRFLLKRAH